MMLRRSRGEAEEAIDRQIQRGEDLLNRDIRSLADLDAAESEYSTWNEYNRDLLRRLFVDENVIDGYTSSPGMYVLGDRSLGEMIDEHRDDVSTKLRRLTSIRERLELYDEPEGATSASPKPRSRTLGDGIFIVHGHDEAIREGVARFVTSITSMEPLILHEQPNEGSETLIEKLERVAANAGFAIVLLTGDDVGGPANIDPDQLQPRARQNVVLELGYFFGRFGRERVVALYEHGVELPSDAVGVMYVPIDGADWKLQLARTLKAAGYEVDADKLL
jgi:predicted nucleotide-binding protein